MAYISDEQAARDYIATLRNQIFQEEQITINRIEKYRSFMRNGEALEYKEREEWAHLNDRIRPMRQEIDAVIKMLSEIAALRAPAPMIIVS